MPDPLTFSERIFRARSAQVARAGPTLTQKRVR